MPHSAVKAFIAMPGPLFLRWFFALSVVLGLTAGGLYMYRRATLIVVAVGPQSAPQAEFIQEVAEALAARRQNFRFSIRYTSGAQESAKLLLERKANVAVLRSDYLDIKDARALVVLHRRTFFAIARVPAAKAARKGAAGKATPAKAEEEESKAEEPKLLDLAGRLRTALVARRGSRDDTAIAHVLTFFDRGEAAKSMQRMTLEEARAAFVAGKVDMLIMLAHPSESDARDLVDAARKAAGKRFTLLVPPAAKGTAYQLRQLETSSVPAGIFGGNPPLPAADVGSIAITYDLVATTQMSERRAALLTKALYELRSELAGANDGEFGIELPSLEERRRYLPHPGAVAQINGESQTLLEEYSDIIWLSLFAAGGIGSALSALLAWLGIGRRRSAGI